MNKTFNQTKKEIINFLNEITCYEYSYPEQREFNSHDPLTPKEIEEHIRNTKNAQQNIQDLKSLATTDLEKDEVVKLNSHCYYELQSIAVLREQKRLFTDPDLINTDFFIYQNDRDPEIYLHINEKNRANPKTIENVLMQLNLWGNPKHSILSQDLQKKIIEAIPKDISESLEFNVSLHKYDNLAHFSKLTGFTSPEDLSRGMTTAISHNTKQGAHALIEQAPMDVQNEIEKTFVSFYPFLSERMRSNEDTIIQAISINPENIFDIPKIELSEDTRKKVLSIAVKELLPKIQKETEDAIFNFSIANKAEKISRFLSNSETNKKINEYIENPDEFIGLYCVNQLNNGLKKEFTNDITETVKSPRIRR